MTTQAAGGRDNDSGVRTWELHKLPVRGYTNSLGGYTNSAFSATTPDCPRTKTKIAESLALFRMVLFRASESPRKISEGGLRVGSRGQRMAFWCGQPPCTPPKRATVQGRFTECVGSLLHWASLL